MISPTFVLVPDPPLHHRPAVAGARRRLPAGRRRRSWTTSTWTPRSPTAVTVVEWGAGLAEGLADAPAGDRHPALGPIQRRRLSTPTVELVITPRTVGPSVDRTSDLGRPEPGVSMPEQRRRSCSASTPPRWSTSGWPAARRCWRRPQVADRMAHVEQLTPLVRRGLPRRRRTGRSSWTDRGRSRPRTVHRAAGRHRHRAGPGRGRRGRAARRLQPGRDRRPVRRRPAPGGRVRGGHRRPAARGLLGPVRRRRHPPRRSVR